MYVNHSVFDEYTLPHRSYVQLPLFDAQFLPDPFSLQAHPATHTPLQIEHFDPIRSKPVSIGIGTGQVCTHPRDLFRPSTHVVFPKTILSSTSASRRIF